jgi:hypothetical protein
MGYSCAMYYRVSKWAEGVAGARGWHDGLPNIDDRDMLHLDGKRYKGGSQWVSITVKPGTKPQPRKRAMPSTRAAFGEGYRPKRQRPLLTPLSRRV